MGELLLNSTGEMIESYLKENDISIQQLVNKSNVSAKTVALTINDTVKLNRKIAYALTELIPEISIEMLVVYDAKYQLYKERMLSNVDLDKFNHIISEYNLRRVFKEERNNMVKLYKKFSNYADVNSFTNGKINFKNNYINFSKAKVTNNKYNSLQGVFVEKAIDDYKDYNEPTTFNEQIFNQEFDDILSYCNANSSQVAMQNMKLFCDICGINLIFKKNVAGLRVKGACLEDNENNKYIILTDLFSSLESVLLTFIHECIHIKNKDYIVEWLEDEEKENESKVDNEVRKMIVKNRYIMPKDEGKIISTLSNNLISNDSPINLAYIIFENDTGVYNMANLNKIFLHSFKVDME